MGKKSLVNGVLVKSFQNDQQERHNDVFLFLDILDQYSNQMSDALRDEYFMVIFDILNASTVRAITPLPS